MVEDVEAINFRKLKCNNHKVSFCFMEELPTEYKTIREEAPQEEQNRIGFSCKANCEIMSFK